MSRITVTEKEHWKERIDRRINKAIATLEAKDPSMSKSITEQAERAAHEALGTLEHHLRLEEIKQQCSLLESEQKQLQLTMYRHGLGKPQAGSYYEYNLSSDFWSKHRKLCESIEESLLAKLPLGQEIRKLRHEKEALLDTVWLATSSNQIRELWTRVSAVLGEESTQLQQQVLTSKPESDD